MWSLEVAIQAGILVLGVGAAVWKLARWPGSVNSDRDHFKAFMKAIREDIRSIRESVQTILLRSTATVTSGSPLRLTDLGQRVSETMNAAQWADQLAPSLRKETAGMESYQIDQFADRYVGTRLSEEWQTKVKRTAYEFGLDAASVRSALRVVLRDALLRGVEPGT